MPQKTGRLDFWVFVTGVTLAVVVFVAASVLIDKHTRRKNEQRFLLNQQREATIAATALEARLESILAYATAIAPLHDELLGIDDAHPHRAAHSLPVSRTTFPEILAQVCYHTDVESAAARPMPPSDFTEDQNSLLATIVEYAGEALETREGFLVPPFRITGEYQQAVLLIPQDVKSAKTPCIVGLLVDLKPMIERYVYPLRSSQYGAAYVLDGRGAIVYDHETQVIGRNVFDGMHTGYPSLQKLDDREMSETKGTAEYQFTKMRSGEVIRKLVSWDSAGLGQERLIVAISAPEAEVNASLADFQRERLLSIAGLVLCIVLMTAMFLRKRSQNEVEEAQRQLERVNADLLKEIDERSAVEKRLRAEERRYRYLFNQSPLGIMHFDPNGVIVECNQKFASILGTTVESLAGFDMLARVSDAKMLQAVKDCLEHGSGSFEGGYTSVTAGKTTTVRALFNRLLSESGTPLGGIAIVEDVTERKRNEEEQRRLEARIFEAQKLESLGILAGGIAHDFNNLLVGIMGSAGLALMELSPESPVRDTIVQIETAAQHAAELTRQMLAYSGKGRFVLEPIDMSRLIEEMIHLLESSISKKAVLRLNFDKHLPPIEAEPAQIRQIMMNLIINASDALEEQGGVITICTGVIEADMEYLANGSLDVELNEGRYVFAEVSDTGRGMDAETQKKIFDPFFTTKFTGRGLGLAAVLGIVRGHKGFIKVYSEPGSGSSFKVGFPAMEGNVLTQIKTPTPEAQPLAPMHVALIVDDERIVREVASRILQRYGCREVVTAEDGEKALVYFREHHTEISVVLLDMTMPNLSGEETFREMRRITTKVPVVLTSGYTEQEATSRFAGKGLAGFIQKPFRPVELIEMIQKAMKIGTGE